MKNGLVEKSNLAFVGILVAVFGMTNLYGCDVSMKVDSKPSTIAKLSYMQDQHGICYAMLGSMTSGGYIVTTITSVPCEALRNGDKPHSK